MNRRCPLSTLDRVQKRLHGLVGDDLFSTQQHISHSQDVASLSLRYRYSYREGPDEIQSLIPPLLTVTAKTRQGTHIVENTPH